MYRLLHSALIIIAIVTFGTITNHAQGRGRNSGLSTIPNPGQNRIEGRITSDTGRGVYNAFVELYNEMGSLVATQRSTGQGRFSFRGMPAGVYVIVVKPLGTNLMDESREVELINQIASSDSVNVDIRLRVDKRFQSTAPTIVGTIFAQDVPENAVVLYKKAIQEFDSNSDAAFSDLDKAINIFPTYFDALAALGKAHVVKGDYEKGYPYLLRAIDINNRCSDCYYSLGIAFYKINQLAAGIKAVEAASILQPQEPSIRLLHGILLRLTNDLNGAEKTLLMANSLYKEPNAETHWQLSLVYNRMNKNLEAADQLEAYLKANPDVKKEEKESVNQLIAKLRSRPASK